MDEHANDSYLDPTPTKDPIQPAPAAGAGMLSGLGDKWHSFIDHPENRAGMMQFAVNMLSGRGLGESIGSAAEASGRNIGAQQEAEAAQEAEDIKQRETATKESQAESYAKIASRPSASDVYYQHLDANEQKAMRLAGRKEFGAWLNDPVSGGGIMKDITTKFPNVKSKDDLQRAGNEAALEYARQRHATLEGGGGGAPARGPATEFKPPPGAVPMNVNGNKVWYDPKTKRPVPGQFGT